MSADRSGDDSARSSRPTIDELAYATFDSPLGVLSAAATDEGLVRLAYDRGQHDKLLDGLPATARTTREGSRLLDGVRRQLDGYFERRLQSFDIEIDWRLAPGGFMRRALAATMAIPFGELVTYRELAGAAGNPRAIRAAGTALARNPIAIVVPCHRVVRADGRIGRYDSGPASNVHKEYLLRLEGAWPPATAPSV